MKIPKASPLSPTGTEQATYKLYLVLCCMVSELQDAPGGLHLPFPMGKRKPVSMEIYGAG